MNLFAFSHLRKWVCVTHSCEEKKLHCSWRGEDLLSTAVTHLRWQQSFRGPPCASVYMKDVLWFMHRDMLQAKILQPYPSHHSARNLFIIMTEHFASKNNDGQSVGLSCYDLPSPSGVQLPYKTA